MSSANPILRWFVSITGFFRLINNRRLDNRFGVLPQPRLLIALVLAGVFLITILGIFADPVILQWLQAGNAQKEGWFAYTTDIGKSKWMLISTGSVLLVMSLIRTDRFKAKKRIRWHRTSLSLYFLFTTIAFSGLLALLMKNAIGRARPPFVEDMQVWQLSPFGDNYEFASFPSGHATTAGAVTMALALLFPRMAVFLLLAAIWLATTRVAIGVHFPSDVTAGVLFGALFSWLYARAFAHRRLLFEFGDTGKLRLRH